MAEICRYLRRRPHRQIIAAGRSEWRYAQPLSPFKEGSSLSKRVFAQIAATFAIGSAINWLRFSSLCGITANLIVIPGFGKFDTLRPVSLLRKECARRRTELHSASNVQNRGIVTTGLMAITSRSGKPAAPHQRRKPSPMLRPPTSVTAPSAV